MNIFNKLFKNNKKIVEMTPIKKVEEKIKFDHRHKLAIEADKYKDNPIVEKLNPSLKEYTFEEAFKRVFNRTEKGRYTKPKDIEQFKTELILYSAGKLSPDTIVEKYDFGSRSFFTGSVIWGFYYHGFDFRTDHMRKIGVIPIWLYKKIK